MTHKPSSALRSARQWHGLTIRQLRDATGVSTGRLSMIERGMVQPNAAEQERLAAALEQTVEALFPRRPSAIATEPPRPVVTAATRLVA
jgi:transcriptional regulator with XRE-family HTH domain